MSKIRRESRIAPISALMHKKILTPNHEFGNTLNPSSILFKDAKNKLNNKRLKFKAQSPLLNNTRKNFKSTKNLIKSDVEK